MKKCDVCGKENADTATKCVYCDAVFAVKTAPPASPVLSNEEAVCPQCGYYLGSQTICQVCGFQRTAETSDNNTQHSASPPPNQGHSVQTQNFWQRLSPRWKKISLAVCLGLAFLLGILVHMAVGIKSSDYQALTADYEKLQEDNRQLNQKFTDEQAAFQAYKTKMQPYEGVQLIDAQNKANAEQLRIEQEKKAAEEAAAAEKAAQEKAAADAAAAKAAEEAKGYETGITYDQLARTPDEYKGKKVKFKGKVLQVIEGDTETQLRLGVNGSYDQVLYCSVPKEKTASTRILEDDSITIMGRSAGLITYTATIGGKITIPSVLVDDWGPNG